MMTREERYRLAQDFCSRMASEYPLLVGGVYGSTARRQDTPHSDLELWFVVESGCQAGGKHFIFRDTAVGYRVYEEQALIEILTHPDARWPFHMGVLDQLQVLQGDPELPRHWLEAGLSTPRPAFYRHLQQRLPELVVESHGRMHSSQLRGDWPTARYALQEVLFEMLTALCLLNQRWVTRDYDAGLLEAARFEKLPEGYAGIVSDLLLADNFQRALSLADKLVSEFWRLIAAEGIRVPNYQSVEEIPL